ncbi:thioesterase domain-containing protein [Streptomyces cinerochromogenes]|uniref:thioesterase domain-containing protein n=1 Tax=Streptomyces cinerochromogenes TaxID=66422 RepID=UPI0036A24C41
MDVPPQRVVAGSAEQTSRGPTPEAGGRRHPARVDALLRPDGRSRLGGWSMGGLLALETARELRALGYTVDSVAAIDVLEGPQELRRAPSTESELLMWLGKGLAGTARVPWRPSAPVTTPDELYGAPGAAGALSAHLGRPERFPGEPLRSHA